MRDEVEVAVVGGGLAGSTLASILSARGFRVALFDLHEVYPPDFRAEKLAPREAEHFDQLGLWDRVRHVATPIHDLSIARFGRVVEHRPSGEYGIEYADLVNALRATLPAAAYRFGRVARVDASEADQTLILGDGRVVHARITVLATGLGKNLIAGLGVRRISVQDDHCLAIGFDLKVARPIGPNAALTYHGESPADRSAYLTLFPIGQRLRANLFVYRRRDDDWSRAFCRQPRETLLDMMPGLPSLIGAFDIMGRPALRPIDLYATAGHLRDGVVLIGDAFSTSCPAAGGGVEKALTDVERLLALIPGWLAAGHMSRDRIETFYTDPAKVACDERSRRMIAYAKSISVDPGLVWTFRRYGTFYGQRIRDWWRRRVRASRASRAA